MATGAVSYARYSTEQQDSLADQEARTSLLARRHGADVIRTFSDPATSRSRGDRPGLLAMLEFLRQNQGVKVIVLTELERVTGTLRQRVQLDDLCRRNGIRLLHEDGVVDPGNEEQLEQADRKALDAAAEVRRGRVRTRRTMESKVLSGTVMMRPPFGVRMKPVVGPDGHPLPSGVRLLDSRGRKVSSGRIEVHPDEIGWLEPMFRWVAIDGLSVDAVARRLTEAGVPPKNSKTSGRTAWARSSVMGILENPFYKGEMAWGHQKTVRLDGDGRPVLVVRDQDDPERHALMSPLGALIDPELWLRANDLLKARAGNSVHVKRQRNEPRAFDHLVFCGRCGLKMYGRNDAKPRKDGTRLPTWRYVCAGARPGAVQVDGFAAPCGRYNGVSERQLIKALSELALADSGAVSAHYVVPADQAARVAVARSEVRDLMAAWDRTLEMARRGLIDLDRVEELKVDHDRAVASAKLRTREDMTASGSPVVFTLDARVAVQEVCRLLRERQLPADVLRAGLQDMGLVRILADAPTVKFEWAVGPGT